MMLSRLASYTPGGLSRLYLGAEHHVIVIQSQVFRLEYLFSETKVCPRTKNLYLQIVKNRTLENLPAQQFFVWVAPCFKILRVGKEI